MQLTQIHFTSEVCFQATGKITCSITASNNHKIANVVAIQPLHSSVYGHGNKKYRLPIPWFYLFFVDVQCSGLGQS